ncbi:MAG: hypothetical protein N4A64_13620 [Marinisporobacter sp.]|jgi:hypothetical protein|nr:hypothetical protein [Marinisporobacter sp.]
MKKSKFIAAVLIIAVMLMGAGYAAWNETITINNTAETGELKVGFKKLVWQSGLQTYPKIIAPDHVNANVVHGEKTTKVNISNMYPGGIVRFEAMIENFGTIPAKFASVKVNLNECSKEMKENLRVFGEICIWENSSAGTRPQIIKLPLKEEIKLSQLEKFLNDNLKNIELKPGAWFTFDIDDEYKKEIKAKFKDYDIDSEECLFFHLPMSVGNDLENKNAKFDITFNFKQFNK